MRNPLTTTYAERSPWYAPSWAEWRRAVTSWYVEQRDYLWFVEEKSDRSARIYEWAFSVNAIGHTFFFDDSEGEWDYGSWNIVQGGRLQRCSVPQYG